MGEKIKELRESKGISQYRLAELTGINRSTINRYENGSIQKISFDNLLKICEALETDIKESGLKKKWIAEQLDITYNSLRRKLKGEIHFSKLELEKLRSILEKYL